MAAEALDAATPFSKSTMSRDEMIEIVSCGKLIPGNVMPSFREFAWTSQFPCGGKTEADVPGDAYMPPIDLARWRAQRSERFAADAKNPYDYTLTVYERG